MSIKVILADDSVPAQNMGKKILLDAGYEVVTASNGLEAWRKIAESMPDIAILDIFMPGYTGLELCARLRKKQETATLPVILTVGRLEPYRPEDGEQVHSNAVIVKPFAAAELIAAVRSLIGGVQQHESENAAEAEGSPLQGDPLHESDNLTGENPVETDPLSEPVTESQRSQSEEFLVSANEPAAKETHDPLGREAAHDARESNGPETLAFNPDAKHTPFTASTAEFLPQAQSSDPSAFGGFGLDSAATTSELEELMPASAAPVNEAALGDFDEAPTHPAAPVHEEAPLDVPPTDPLLDLQETADFAEETAPSQPAEDPEDEARRLAFEQLFNSSELPPLEGYDGSSAEAKILPSLANQWHDPSSTIEPDPELEPLLEANPTEHAHAATDPFLMEELEPIHTTGQIPNRDSLLDGGAEPDWAAAKQENLQGHSESFDLGARETLPSMPEVQADPMLMPALETAETASQFEPIQPLAHFDAESSGEIAEQISEPAVEAAPAIEAASAQMPALDEADEDAPVFTADSEMVAAAEQHEQEFEPLDLPEAAVYAGLDITHVEVPEPEAAQFESEGIAASFAPELGSSIPGSELELEDADTQVEWQRAHFESEQLATAYVEHVEPEPIAGEVPAGPEPIAAEEVHAAIESAGIELQSELTHSLNDQERVQQAVDRVFNRFKRLLVSAIVRELARND